MLLIVCVPVKKAVDYSFILWFVLKSYGFQYFVQLVQNYLQWHKGNCICVSFDNSEIRKYAFSTYMPIKLFEDQEEVNERFCWWKGYSREIFNVDPVMEDLTLVGSQFGSGYSLKLYSVTFMIFRIYLGKYILFFWLIFCHVALR